jgi:YARHG domain
MSRLLAGLALSAVLVGVVAPGAVRAACYEDVGCSDTDLFVAADLERLAECDILWEMRNTIYKEHGYCFHTPEAIAHFGNAGCKFDDAADVPLNSVERDNVTIIKSVEQRKGCTE